MRSLIACVTLVMAVGAAADDAAVRKQVQAMYRQVEGFYAKKDAKSIANFMLPSVTLKGMDGQTRTRDQWLKQTQQELNHVKTARVRYTLLHVNVKGDTAVVDRLQGRIANARRTWQGTDMPDFSLFGNEHVRQYEATGGKLFIDWNHLQSRFRLGHQRKSPDPETGINHRLMVAPNSSTLPRL